ncbi:MAG: hypothetical protein WCT48_05365, partial [Candidatus Paceibacterota bacterium]
EISKAYYGEFVGTSTVFTIRESKPFKLYVGVLVPTGYGAPANVSAEIRKESDLVANLSATSTEWTRFYEPFGGDDYFQGPEFRADATSGAYTITVSRPENTGKYVLVIGETESFTIDETIRTLGVLPSLKSEFFGKPAWTAYLNRIGLFAGLGIVGAIIVLLLIQSFFKKLFGLFKKKKVVD